MDGNPLSRRIDPEIAVPPFNVAFVNINVGNDSTGSIVRNFQTQTIFAPPVSPGNGYFASINGAVDAFETPTSPPIPLAGRIVCVVQSLFDFIPRPGWSLSSDRVYRNIIFTSIIIIVEDVNPDRGFIFLRGSSNQTETFQVENCSVQSTNLQGFSNFGRVRMILQISDGQLIEVAMFSVTISGSSISSQLEDVVQLELQLKGISLFDDITFILQSDPIDDDFNCLLVNGELSGSFPNLDSEASKDVIIVEGSTTARINFDGSLVDDNDIDITSNGAVVMVQLDNPVKDQTFVFIEDFTFNIDTERNNRTALFMTEGNTEQIDGLFNIQECTFDSDEQLAFNNTSSLTSLFNSFFNIDFLYNRVEAESELAPDVIEIIPNESPINYSMVDMSFHSSVSQFYIPETINKSVELEVNDKFIYYIDASNGSIVITLPSGNLDIEGKMVIFKRVDKSRNKVKLRVNEGLIENRKILRFPGGRSNECHNDRLYPSITLHFRERNWWIISTYNF